MVSEIRFENFLILLDIDTALGILSGIKQTSGDIFYKNELGL